MKVLVTGGAGFIGSHIVDALLVAGHDVVVFDSLDPQVHGPERDWPSYLNPHARRIRGDIRDYDAVKRAIVDENAEVIFHEAAAVGVGQSMYQIRRYVEVNSIGAANLLDIIANERHKVGRMIVASSMSIYGEGRYRCDQHGEAAPGLRAARQFDSADWEMRCPACGRTMAPLPTHEEKPLIPESIYATTKRDHEEMFLEVGRAYHIPTVALRYFNVYGPRQALSNPYTGLVAIFSTALLAGAPPMIFEDGLQSRDFVHVSDIVQANMLALTNPASDYGIFNVGTGKPTSVLGLLEILTASLKSNIEPTLLGKFRYGDIRHCYADISRICEKLGYRPTVPVDRGVAKLVSELGTRSVQEKSGQMLEELKARRLTS